MVVERRNRFVRSQTHSARSLCRYAIKATICLIGVVSGVSFAAQDVYVPPALEEWKDWVLADHPNIYCPIDDATSERMPCVWTSELAIDLKTGDPDRITFRIAGHASADSYVELPTADRRPIEVELNGSPARVGLVNGNPRVFVDRGSFEVTGYIDIESAPRSLGIRRSAAIVELRIDGQEVAVPKVEDGKLWLQAHEETQGTSNSLRLDVYRRLRDEIPQILDTRIRLTVDGADRVETIGKPILDGFHAVSIDADMPVQVMRDGTFLVQASRGVSWVSVHAISEQVLNEFTPVASGPQWPISETWVFLPRTQHRTVDVEGAPPIDPILVDSPFGSAPTYNVSTGTTLRLTNEQRGNPNPKPSSFNIAREMWLGFDGASMVVVDELHANVPSETRVGADYNVGTVQVDGSNRLVTYVNYETDSTAGITLHPSERHIEAVSLLESRSDIAANGWLVDADSLSINLHIPPGWKLLWASGVDRVNESWLSSWWNLWDIFICVLIVVVLYRVGGLPVAVVVSIAILLGYQEHTATAIGWLVLGVLLLLDKQLTSANGKRINQIVYWTLMVPIAVMSLYVAATNVRQAVYPQLEASIGPALTAAGITAISEDGSELEVGASFIRRDNFDLASPSAESARHRAATRERDKGVEEVVVTGNMLFDATLQTPLVAVQTGPGKPTWNWDRATFHWAGPVSKEQRVGLTFLPPAATRVVFALVAVLHLLILMILVLAKVGDRIDMPPWFRKATSILLIGVVASSANASFPDSNLLRELEDRLTASPECAPGCASLESASLTMEDENQLELDLLILAGAEVAVRLPISTPRTSLKEVSRNGLPQPLFHDRGGRTYIEARVGQNQFRMRFDVRGIDDLVIEFPLVAAQLSSDVCCWRVSEGVESDRHRIVLNRMSEDSEDVSLSASNYEFHLPLTVERVLDLQYEPTVRTTVKAHGDRTETASAEIPLLTGETVLSSHITVRDGRAIVIFEPDESAASWQSSLSLTDELLLSAPAYSERTERWFLRGSDFWQFEATGVTPSQTERNATVFLPRQGETLTLKLTKPTPIPGNTLTINNVNIATMVGARTSSTAASFSIESSVADSVTLNLPDGAVLEGISIDGENRPMDTGNVVNFPITHGDHNYAVSWRMDEPLGWFYQTPTIEFDQVARNVSHSVHMAKNRWVLMLGGPAIGSAVLFWGVVIVTVLVALGLTYLPRFPLTKLDAVLVAVGATLANIWALLFVALWTLSVWWRARSKLDDLPVYAYRAIQIVLGILAFVGLLALFFTVLSALRTPPDMYITASSMFTGQTPFVSPDVHLLHWFADESIERLPTAWVFSLPFWVYQLTMLAWSLWLVFALIKWIRATFAALGEPSFWPAYERRKAIDDEDVVDSEPVEAIESDTTESERDIERPD